MASKKVTVLKFVGTVSLGLLTGTSYAMSDVILPFLETSSAASDTKSFRELVSTSTLRLTALSGVSGSAFFLAFIFSPSGYRHPYLFYTSVLCLGAHLSEYATEYVFGKPDAAAAPTATTASQRRAAQAQARKEKAAAKRMVASYDVLDDSRSDEGTASGEELLLSDDEVVVGGEELLRIESDFFKQTLLVRTALSGVGFAMAVLGIWGDGAHQVPDSFIFGEY